MSQHTSSRNPWIDIFRLVCSIMVLIIHTSPLSEVNATAAFFTGQILPRIAVPYFFAVSGYFYTNKLQKNAPTLPYLRKLLLTYVLWSIPYVMVSFFQWGLRNPLSFCVDCAYSFLISGSYYHFWYFPALFLSIGITTILWKLRCKHLLIPTALIAYIIGCFGCAYYQFGIQIPLLSGLYQSSHFPEIRRCFLMGFPFFICGHMVRLLLSRLKKDNKVLKSFFLPGAIALWGIELYWIISRGWYSNIIITPMLYPLTAVTLLCLLQSARPTASHTADKCRAAANFMYYSHPLFNMLFELLHLTPTFNFLLTAAATFYLGTQLSKRREAIVPYLIG